MTEDIIDSTVETYEEKDELTLLKERADMMGIKYHANIGVETLKERVNGQLTPKVKEPLAAKTPSQVRMEKVKEANRLVRIRITCMDPNKKGWKGEYFTCMNSVYGTIKKYVPYNVIWHVPVAILKQIKRKKRQEFYEVKGKYGLMIKRSRMVPMFAIEELPDLTHDELTELATQQAVNHSID